MRRMDILLPFRKDIEKRRLEIAQEQIRRAWEERAWRLLRTPTLAASQINTGPLTTTMRERLHMIRAQRYEAAKSRSHELLLRFLSAEQAKQLEDGNSFITTSPSGRKWEIRQGGIDLLDDNSDRIRSYCYLADEAEGLPVYDQMLARKLMVEHHEGQILRDGVVTYDRDASTDSTEDRLRFWVEQHARIRQRLNRDLERERHLGPTTTVLTRVRQNDT